jgi:RimJ/RimL family protein N-acetyltransferase
MSMDTAKPLTGKSPDLLHTLDHLGQRIRGRLKPTLVARTVRYGLRRDLAAPLEHVNAKIPISSRRMTQSDVDIMLPEDASALPPADQLEVKWRRLFLDKAGIANGFVAVDERDGSPCYMQWLFGRNEADIVADLGGFPRFGPDEALLECAYTPPSHRGLGIMSAAMALFAEHAAEFGARYVHTFVGTENIPSLKGCRRAGFDPHLLHTRRFRLFGVLRDDTFEVMADDDPRRRWEM